MSIAQRVEAILDNINKAVDRSGRDCRAVRLVAVSKRKPASDIMEAYEAGLRDFGENYVQEALTKIDALPTDIRWHMIGHLQSNKAKQIVGAFDLLHTVDRPSLAKELNRQAIARGITLPILLQANLAGEDSKAGTNEDGALLLAKDAEKYPALAIKGLMCIPPWEANPEDSRPHFIAMRILAEKIAALEIPGVEMKELSMGMSHDYTVAIEEGATLVRVGSAIFGERE